MALFLFSGAVSRHKRFSHDNKGHLSEKAKFASGILLIEGDRFHTV